MILLLFDWECWNFFDVLGNISDTFSPAGIYMILIPGKVIHIDFYCVNNVIKIVE